MTHEEESVSVHSGGDWRHARALSGRDVALSCAQRVVWFELQLNPECGIYVLAGFLSVDGPVVRATLERALRFAVGEYDALRLTFRERDGIPCQEAHDAVNFALDELHFEGPDAEQQCQSWMAADSARSFVDLAQPLFRFMLLRAGARSFWYMKYSHLVFDGWSTGTFIGRVAELYDAFSAGDGTLARRYSYLDFVRYEQHYLESKRYREDAEYWAALYQNQPEPIFAHRQHRAAVKRQNMRLSLPLAESAIDNLVLLASAWSASVQDVVLAAWCGYLCIDLKRGEVAVGVPTHNRVQARFRKTPGMFTSVLPVRVAVDSSCSFQTLVASVTRSMRRHYRHQQYPLSDLARKLHLTPTEAAQLCDVTLSVEPFSVPMKLGGHPAILRTLTGGFNRGALHVVAQLHQGRQHGFLHFDYDPTLLARAEVERLATGFFQFLSQIEANQQRPLAEWPLASVVNEPVVAELSVGARAPAWTREQFLDCYRLQVKAAPTARAAIGGGETLSFLELEVRSNQLARYLLAQGVRSGSIVGVRLPRSIDVLVSFLGVLKAGCAYLPLDPSSPQERLEEMCRQTEPAAIIATDASSSPTGDWLNLDLQRERPAIAALPGTDPQVPLYGDALAYVTYTSGSTGAPLGVMVSHRGLANLARAQASTFEVTEHSRIYAFASIGFDASISEFAMALVSGAAVDFGPSNERFMSAQLCSYLRDAAVTHVTLPPSLLRALSREEIPERTTLIAAGEDCPRAVIEGQRWAHTFNAYGPTEATVCASIYRYDSAVDGFPIGRPIANCRLYVLDEQLRQCAIGVVGHLYVGGVGIAWGYLKQPGLSAQRFLPDPFADEPGARMYRTGDLAKWRRDGNLDFCGRADRQLKIRGHRIEPAEIEAALLRYQLVKGAVVTAYGRNDGSTGLAAYLAVADSVSDPCDEHVAQWRALYDDLFQTFTVASTGSDFTGWVSSYTGTPIPLAEMQEWLDETVRDVEKLAPRRVLEIGCGSGLLLSRLAPGCDVYVGIDLSAEVLKRASANLTRKDLAHVRLMNLAAHELDGFEDGCFDTVVLNSVVQYFPSLEYLEQVLRAALRVTRSGGFVYVGDVRCLQLLKGFCAAIEAERAPSETTAKQLRNRVEERARFQEELLVGPEWFARLPLRTEVASARVRLKRGVAQNELTRFRYQVLLEVDHRGSETFKTVRQPPDVKLPEHSWREGESSLASIALLLSDGAAPGCVIRAIPNARLAREAALVDWLSHGDDDCLSNWRQQTAFLEYGVQPAQLEELARQHGRQVSLTYAQNGDPFALDAVFYTDREPNWDNREFASTEDGARYANQPTAKRQFSRIVPEVHASLGATLPSYMLPSAYALVKEFPLTLHGKLDYSALPAARPLAVVTDDSSSEPLDEVEQTLARIWSSVLGVKVGTHSSFVELGGDSIQCLQVVNKARDAGINVSAKQIFEGRTIASIAQLVGRADQDPASDRDAFFERAPLTPIQRWFFEQPLSERAHFNQFVSVSPPSPLDPARLARALALVEQQHASLRLRFQPTAAGWQQWLADTGSVPFEVVDVRHLSAEQQSSAITEDAQRRQRSLSLDAGPIWSAVYYRASAGADQFLWLIHHLAVDGFSWRILLGDLESNYRRLPQTVRAQSHDTSTSFLRWAVRLHEYAQTATAQQRSAHLQQVTDPNPLSTEARRTAIQTARSVLSRAMSRQLTVDAPTFYDCSTQDLLLTALTLAWRDWREDAELRILLEGHGREPLFDDVDISRTTGWFTTLLPLALKLEPRKDLASHVADTRSQLQDAGRLAIEYGLQSYFGADAVHAESLAAGREPALSFNYLGHMDPEPTWAIFADIGAHSFGLSRGDVQHRLCGLELQILATQEQYHLVWSYDDATHDRASVERLAELFTGALRELVAAAPNAERHSSTTELSSAADARPPGHPTDQEPQRTYPLSPAQQGIVFHSLADSSRHAYFEQLLFTIEGKLEIDRFWQAWELLVERHAVLRTQFVDLETGTPLQEIRRTVSLPRLTLDWQNLPEATQRQRLAELVEQDRLQKFVLSKGPLLRMTLARATADRTYFLWSHHHAVLDGWSVALLVRELFEVYRALTHSLPLQGAPVAQYQDYVAWLASGYAGEDPNDYWRRTLRGFPSSTPLNFAPAVESGVEPQLDEARLVLSEELTTQLRALAKSGGVTLGVLFQGAWSLLLSRCSGNRDVMFGIVSSGRSAPVPGIQSIPGLFIHTLPVRVRLDENCRIEDFLGELQRAQLERDALHPLGLIAIQKCSEIPLGEPLFESLVVVENYPRDLSLLAELGLQLAIEHLGVHTNYPVTLLVAPGEQLELRLAYDADRFSGRACQRLLGWLENLLQQMAEDPGRPLHRLSLLDRVSYVDLLRQCDRSTDRSLPKRTLVELFAEQAAAAPDRVALIHRQRTMSYGQLDHESSLLAAFLRQRGVRPECLVGICLDRSLRLIVAILGVLKAGGAYVPVDPNHPADRLRLIAERAKLNWIVTANGTQNKLSCSDAELIDVDSAIASFAGSSTEAIQHVLHEDNLAYVLYTSGSTGVPKGVAISAASPVALIDWARGIYSAEELRRTLFSTSINFDLSVFEIFAPLCLGGGVVIADSVLELPELSDVTLVNTVPSAMMELLRVGGLPASVSTVNLAGEPVPRALVRDLRALSSVRKVYNLYGPSETTTYSTFANLESTQLLPPIGAPLDHEAAYILDHNMNLQAPGVAGDLYIAGRGLARGYFDDPGKTAVSFLPNPFSTTPGSRLYRTGDVARYGDDGQIEFLGRKDHQVKIRGHRIELEEIEACLRRCADIADAVVSKCHDDRLGDHLVAHVTMRQPASGPAPVSEWKAALRRILPEYMIPQRFTLLEELPRTPNGKVDRLALGRALPTPLEPEPADGAAVSGSREPLESRVAGIYRRLLRISVIDRSATFFDLGGHSLLLLSLAEELRREFGVEVPLADLRTGLTVPDLARVLGHYRTSTLAATSVRSASAAVLQAGGDGPPLYLICPASGSPMGYLEFAAEFAGRHPVIGLQAPGLNKGDRPLRTVEELARHFLQIVVQQSYGGPFLVGGWSFGGLVAFELARQLRAQGKEAAAFLFDTELLNPNDQLASTHSLSRAWKKISNEFVSANWLDDGLGYAAIGRLAAWLGLALPRSLEHFRERTGREQIAFTLDAARTLNRSARVFWCNYRAARAYRLQYLHADVYLFRTLISQDSPLQDDPCYLALASKVSGRLEAVAVPGTHMTLFAPANRKALADEVGKRLASYAQRNQHSSPRRAHAPTAIANQGRAPLNVQPDV